MVGLSSAFCSTDTCLQSKVGNIRKGSEVTSNRVRSQEVLVPGVLGIAVLGLLLGLAKAGRFDTVKMVGVLIGLAGGFLCGLLLLLERLERRDKKMMLSRSPTYTR